MHKRVKIIIAVVFILTGQLFFNDTVHAAVIRAVELEGNTSVTDETIRAMISSRPGSQLSAEKVRRDIRALYSLEKFQDIQVIKKVVRGQTTLIYHFVEKGRIRSIEFRGNKELDDDDLQDEVTVVPDDIVDPAAITESIKKMREKYLSKGYHLVTIRHRLERVSGQRDQKLVFVIEEHEGIRVKKIRFLGNKVFKDKELRKVIQTKQKGRFSWINGSGKYLKEVVERDVAFLTFHYLNHGYLKVQISPPEVYLTRDRKWLYVYFHIEEGKQYKVNSVKFTGDVLTTPEELVGITQLKSGQTYSRKQLEEDIMKLTELYGDEAYAFASINPQTIPNDEDLTADIVFQIEKGRKIKIEQINIIGNTTTRDKVVRRELEVVENGYYHEGRIRRSREKLMALGFFEEVNFATPRGSTDDQLVLNIRVKEKSTGTFSIGAGFSSVENFILTASLSKENFLGYGISSRFSLELSSRRQLFLLQFEDPYFLDTRWILGASGFRTVNVFEDFDRESFGGTLNLGRRIFEYSRILAGYSIEDVQASDFRTTIPGPFQSNLSGLTSSLSFQVSRDTRNNRLYPTKGVMAEPEQ